MEWELKTKMVQLGNQRHDSSAASIEFQDFVLKHIGSFDAQAWNMFCELTDLIVEEMKASAAFWAKVYPYLQNTDCNQLGFRAGFRMAMLQTICEDELKIS